jgi:hypothetical protein
MRELPLGNVEGSFFISVPPGPDTHLLKDVLHDWDDQHASEVLRNIRTAMSKQSRLVVIERLIAADNQPSSARALDIVMLEHPIRGAGRSRSHHR